jgi:hypothetical protein
MGGISNCRIVIVNMRGYHPEIEKHDVAERIEIALRNYDINNREFSLMFYIGFFSILSSPLQP